MVVLITAALSLCAVGSWAQEADIERLFEAGKHQEVLAAATSDDVPAAEIIYLGAQSAQRLGQDERARQLYDRLAHRSDEDPWAHIGRSARFLMDGNLDEARAAASQSAMMDPSLPQAHYQLGLVLGHRQDYGSAAAAFARAASLDSSFAYAHYHAGLSYYRVKRIDQMATHFEAFLRLAPQAPERGEVEAIMRTIRGR